MTCIVGLEEKGVIYIGGDSAGVGGLSITIRDDEKVFTNGPFIMGFTSSFRMGQLLHHKFDPPKQLASQSDMKFMVTEFITSVQQCFLSGGFGSKETGGKFLVGYNKKLYTIDVDYQVGLCRDKYNAVGCGSDLALGSMFSSVGKKPTDRIKLALNAAAHFSAGVAGPFLLLDTKKVPSTV